MKSLIYKKILFSICIVFCILYILFLCLHSFNDKKSKDYPYIPNQILFLILKCWFLIFKMLKIIFAKLILLKTHTTDNLKINF